MSTKIVVVNSSSKISCCDSDSPQTVVLCLSDPDLIAARACMPEGEETWAYHTIEGTLQKCTRVASPCGTTCTYRYIVGYDDTQLANPSVALTSDEVDGIFCKGCKETWVEDLVGDEVTFASNPDGSFTFVSQHGCEFTIAPGEFVCFSESESAEIGLSEEGCLEVNVRLSATSPNIIQLLSDGLYIPQDVAYNFLPAANNIYSLGSTTRRWTNVYTAGVTNTTTLNITASAGGLNLNALSNGSIAFNSTNQISFASGPVATARLVLNNSGHLVPLADNTYDLGEFFFGFKHLYVRDITSAGQLGLEGDSIDIASTGTDINLQSVGARYDITLNGDHVINTTGGDINLNAITNAINFKTANTTRLQLTSTGMLVPSVDATYDLGVAGTNFRRVYTQLVRSTFGSLDLDSTVGTGIRFLHAGVVGLSIDTVGRLKTVAANETSGAGTATIGAGNFPGVTAGAVNTWLRFTKSDNTALYVPAWA